MPRNKVKGKIAGFLTVCLLAGPLCANAAYIISGQFDASATNAADSFSFQTDSFPLTLGETVTVSTTDDLNGFSATALSFFGLGGGKYEYLSNYTFGLSEGSVGGFILILDEPLQVGVPNVFKAFRLITGLGGLSSELTTATITIRETSVPEPGTLAMLSFGLLGLGMSRRKARIED